VLACECVARVHSSYEENYDETLLSVVDGAQAYSLRLASCHDTTSIRKPSFRIPKVSIAQRHYRVREN